MTDNTEGGGPNASHKDLPDYEIRVTQKGDVQKYFKYAKFLLDGKTKQTQITVKAMGKAIVNAVKLVERIKNIIGNLHQYCRIESTEVEDKKDLAPEESVQKKITTFVTILSKDKLDDKKDYGNELDKVV